MRVSVVVPLYNEGVGAAALLQHLRQIPNLFEAIWVDATDAPESRRQLAELQRQFSGDPLFQLLRSETPSRAKQMNLGARYSRGDIVLFLHCDTRLPRDAVAYVTDCIARGHVWGWFALRLDARGVQYRMLEFMINLRARLTHIVTGDQTMFIARETFMQQNGFAEIELMEDVEFSRRMKRIAAPRRVDKPVLTSARRWRRDGFIATVWLMWRLRFWYWRGVSPRVLAAKYRPTREAA